MARVQLGFDLIQELKCRFNVPPYRYIYGEVNKNEDK